MLEIYSIAISMTRQFFDGSLKEFIVGDPNTTDLLPLYLEKWNWQGDL